LRGLSGKSDGEIITKKRQQQVSSEENEAQKLPDKINDYQDGGCSF